jgi:hypothetical protein
MKLTLPQAELLLNVFEKNGPLGCSDSYLPAKKLVSLGLCSWVHGRFGSSSLVITDAGRAEIEARK